jgi:hypothetical protein
MRWFGANDATLASAERVFEELVECVETSAAATPTLLAWGERLHSLSQEPERLVTKSYLWSGLDTIGLGQG